jgi:hypothetical protein
MEERKKGSSAFWVTELQTFPRETGFVFLIDGCAFAIGQREVRLSMYEKRDNSPKGGILACRFVAESRVFLLPTEGNKEGGYAYGTRSK